MGAANLGLAVGKGFALGGAVAGLGATGVGAPAAAVLAVYGTVSIFGQGLTGAAQLYSAATGNYGTAAGVAQIGNILSGPVSGLGTLLGGGRRSPTRPTRICRKIRPIWFPMWSMGRTALSAIN
jgi:hypothetical protein